MAPLLFLTLPSFSASGANGVAADAPTAHLLRRQSPGEGISELSFPNTNLTVVLVPKDGKLRPFVQIEGLYARPAWNLFVQEKSPVRRPGTGPEFVIDAYLNGHINKVALMAQGPNGEKETETIYLFAPQAQEVQLISPWNNVVVSFGLSAFTYQQTGFGRFESTTGLLGVKYETPNETTRLGVLANLSTTVFTLASSPIRAAPQLVQGQVDASYVVFPRQSQKWKHKALLGASYLTVLSNGSPFGISNLLAPEIGWQTTRELSEKVRLMGLIHFIPLANLANLSQSGLDMNLRWSREVKNLHRAEIGVGFSTFSYQSEKNVKVGTDLIYLQIGYSL